MFHAAECGPMTEPAHDHEREHSEQWRRLLTGDLGRLGYFRKSLGWIPSGPRCKLCLAPLKPPGRRAAADRLRAVAPQPPPVPRASAAWMKPGGAEIELSLLFADVRGSTALAERLPARVLPADLAVLRHGRTGRGRMGRARGQVRRRRGRGALRPRLRGRGAPRRRWAARDLLGETATEAASPGSHSARPCTRGSRTSAGSERTRATSPRSATLSTRPRVSPPRPPRARSSSARRPRRRPASTPRGSTPERSRSGPGSDGRRLGRGRAPSPRPGTGGARPRRAPPSGRRAGAGRGRPGARSASRGRRPGRA